MNTIISLSTEHIQKVKELIAEAIMKLRHEGWEPRRVEVYWPYKIIMVRLSDYTVGYDNESPSQFLMGCIIEYYEHEGIRIVGMRNDVYKVVNINLESIDICEALI